MQKYNMPPGDYYVGDPCHIIEKKDWPKMSATYEGIYFKYITSNKESVPFLLFPLEGDTILVDNLKKKYCIDSAYFCVINKKILKDLLPQIKFRAITFKTFFKVEINENYIIIGNRHIALHY